MIFRVGTDYVRCTPSATLWRRKLKPLWNIGLISHHFIYEQTSEIARFCSHRIMQFSIVGTFPYVIIHGESIFFLGMYLTFGRRMRIHQCVSVIVIDTVLYYR